jgi:hypothetical protein
MSHHHPNPQWACHLLPSVAMATSNMTPTLGFMAPYGTEACTRTQACSCRYQFPCLGQEINEQEKIDWEWCIGLRWLMFDGLIQQPTKS